MNAFGESQANKNEQSYQVQRYSVGWNYCERRGQVNVRPENYNRIPVKIAASSPTEFAPYTTILKENDIYLSAPGWLYIGT